jgi:tRNA U54 and U55 pseudouridine synthase Pus10
MEDQTTLTSKWSDESIIDIIRNLRNDLIKDFLDERHMKEYAANTFGVREVSNVKIEFIKKELKALLIAPVNVTHYQPIIEKIRQSDTASLSEGNEQLFYAEVDTILKNYIF